MENLPSRSRSERFFFGLKIVFLVLLILQFVPVVFGSLRSWLTDVAQTKSHVGCLTIKGPLTDATFYIKKLEDFAKDPDIKALLLKIDSPGGYAGTSQAIFSEVRRFKEQKPVVALVENMCASGAYYIAVAADHIVASPLSLIGSVGTLIELPNVKELLGSWHVSYTHVQSGEFKTAGSPFKKLEDTDRDYFQDLCDDNYTQFVRDVAVCRGINEKAHAQWANGRVFTGNQALVRKMIDSLGSHQDALALIKQLAKLEHEIKLVHPHKPAPVWKLFGYDDADSDTELSLAARCAQFIAQVQSNLVAMSGTIRAT